jgi:hypothetical protein
VLACVRGPAASAEGRGPQGRVTLGPGPGDGGGVRLSSPAALRGVAGWEAYRLTHLPAWLRWIAVFAS